jgi:chlorite dismutase
MADTLSVPATAPAEAEEKKIQRQMIGFNFFKVLPEWRRLPAAERAQHKS